jgi:hypothetical protein
VGLKELLVKDNFKNFGNFLKLTIKDFIERKNTYNYFKLAGIKVISKNKIKSNANKKI